MAERLIVIGGIAAGMSAASQAKRRNPNLEVVVFERDPYISYGACGMPYYLGKLIDDYNTLIVLPLEKAREKRGLDVRVNHEVTGIDVNNNKVFVHNKETGEDFTMEYSRLVITTGARATKIPVEGADLNNIFYLHTLPEGIEIRKFVDQNNPKKVVVIGAGFIGLEVAENFKERGIEVTVVELLPNVLGTMDKDMGDLVVEEMKSNGVDVLLNTKVQGFKGENGKVKSVITDKGEIEADFVIVGIGVKPNTEFLKDTGILLSDNGAIIVDDYMRTNYSEIFAAGDNSVIKHIVTGKYSYIPLALNANRGGRYAGANASFDKNVEKFPGTLGTAIAKVFNIEVARTGLSSLEAENNNFEFVTKTITDHSKAGYFPTKGKITIKLIADKSTKRLIGAILVGATGSALRIDALATAISNKMTIKDIGELDLAYAPPFAPVWDPVLVAANVTAKSLKK